LFFVFYFQVNSKEKNRHNQTPGTFSFDINLLRNRHCFIVARMPEIRKRACQY